MLFKSLTPIFKNLTPIYRFSKLPSHKPKLENSDSTPFDFNEENYKEIEIIRAMYPKNCQRSAVMPLLTLG